MRNIWAVASNTIAQALRMKIAAVTIVLLLILLPLMSVIMSGDGTLLGKLQSFASYGLSLVSVLLCLFTITIATFTLSNDIRRRHLDMVVTKPIHRHQIVLGKFLGIVVLDGMLLAAFTAIVYGLTMAMPVIREADEVQARQARAEFFTARKVIRPLSHEAAMKARAKERCRELEKRGQLPDPQTMPTEQVLQQLYQQEVMANKSVETATVREWEFSGLRASSDPNDVLFVRYKFNASPEPYDSQVRSEWRIGDLASFKLGASRPRSPIYAVERAESVRNVHEFAVPADCVSEEGNLTVAFFNNPSMNNGTVIFEEMELLYRVGSFEANLLRTTLLIGVRLVFLAALGVSLSTWLSFPVGSLVALVVFFAGLINGFIVESLGSFGSAMGTFYRFTIRPLLYLVPRFDGPYSPTEYIVSGHILEWTFLGKAFLITIVIQAVLLILLGIWIFHRREIAKVTV